MATSTYAAHRRPAGPLLSPGQKLAAGSAAALVVLFTLAFQYGTTGRNPILDFATAVAGTWTVATSPATWVLAVLAVPAYRTIRNIVQSPKGIHRA